jgi:hypothetical protein
VPTELKKKWEGVAHGLPEKRLSVSAFGEPLTILLAALRRIATNIVGDAFEEKNVGRFANAARQLDIEITDLVKESSGFDSVITLTPLAGDNLKLFDDLAENASMQLLDAIDSERQGTLKNANVRKYLRALPLGITRQSYWLHNNGNVLREISFGIMDISVLPPELPYLATYLGKVVGVGFEPGRPEVRIKTDTTTVVLTSTTKQVDAALELRYSTVKAVAVVQGSTHKLLILQESHLPIHRSTRDIAIFQKWDGVLRRLAQ